MAGGPLIDRCLEMLRRQDVRREIKKALEINPELSEAKRNYELIREIDGTE